MFSQRQMSLSALFVSVAASLLTLLSTHYTYQSLGQPIIKTLLSPQWMRRLNSNLSGSNNELILVTLKLLNVASNFSSGLERKGIAEAFAWETKVCILQSILMPCPQLLLLSHYQNFSSWNENQKTAKILIYWQDQVRFLRRLALMPS